MLLSVTGAPPGQEFAGAPELSPTCPTRSLFGPSGDGKPVPLGEVLISFCCCFHRNFPFFLLFGSFWKQLVGTLTWCLLYILFPDTCSLPIWSHKMQLLCCSFQTDNPQEPFLCCWIVVTGWQWEPWLEPQPCGEGRDPSPAPGVCWASPCGSDFWNLAKSLIIRQAFVFFSFGGIRISWSDPLSTSCVSNQWDCSRAGVLYKPINAHLCCSIYLCFKGLLWKFEKTSLLWQLMY